MPLNIAPNQNEPRRKTREDNKPRPGCLKVSVFFCFFFAFLEVSVSVVIHIFGPIPSETCKAKEIIVPTNLSGAPVSFPIPSAVVERVLHCDTRPTTNPRLFICYTH